MKNVITAIEFAFKGGRTKRYHTADTLTEQSVGEHSFGVAVFCIALCAAEGKHPSNNLLMSAIMHDLAEHRVGDISSPIKRRNPALTQQLRTAEMEEYAEGLDAFIAPAGALPYALTEKEAQTLKIADYLDGLMFCIRERRYGNSGINYIFSNYRKYLYELEASEEARKVIAQVLQLWRWEIVQ